MKCINIKIGDVVTFKHNVEKIGIVLKEYQIEWYLNYKTTHYLVYCDGKIQPCIKTIIKLF